MSSANYVLTEEKLLCCICLDVFTDPVTLPCGHNFCKDCITQHLNFNCQCKCPMCKEHVDKKYKLGVNTFISELAVQFRQSAGRKARSGAELHDAKLEEVSCDVPIGPKRKSKRSYFLLAVVLVSLTLFFITYLKLLQSLSELKTPRFDTVEKAADSMCREHDKPLELHCQNEKMSLCRSCSKSSHRLHHIESLKEDDEVTEVKKREAGVQQMIQERQLKVLEIMHSVTLSKEAAEREMAYGVEVFDSLIQSIERAQADFFGMIVEKQKTTEEQAEGFIHELLLEISELETRRDAVQQLSASKDRLSFLHIFSHLNTEPQTKDWTGVSICPASYEGAMRTVLVDAVDQQVELVRKVMEKLQEAELERAQQSAVDVTLDPDTAHPALILSDDGKQVHCGEVWRKLPDTSKRFTLAVHVLGKQSFSCGKFHYDVQVKGKTEWTVGVAQQSVNRKEEVELKPEDGYWTLSLRNGTAYFALDSHPVPVTVNSHPDTVKVFVDYEEGRVSFYDIDAAALLYSFTGCSFTEKLHPFFSPGNSDGGRNAAPLIISPIN